jgi:hypothetical protein
MLMNSSQIYWALDGLDETRLPVLLQVLRALLLAIGRWSSELPNEPPAQPAQAHTEHTGGAIEDEEDEGMGAVKEVEQYVAPHFKMAGEVRACLVCSQSILPLSGPDSLAGCAALHAFRQPGRAFDPLACS